MLEEEFKPYEGLETIFSMKGGKRNELKIQQVWSIK